MPLSNCWFFDLDLAGTSDAKTLSSFPAKPGSRHAILFVPNKSGLDHVPECVVQRLLRNELYFKAVTTERFCLTENKGKRVLTEESTQRNMKWCLGGLLNCQEGLPTAPIRPNTREFGG